MAQNKSQAEAVNFGNAVQTKAYEKKAALVDTFVKSETAEQKLARSGKVQTAEALQALASLGGSAVKGKAMLLEEKARKQQESLATTTAQAIEDIEQGRIKNLTESQDYADLPVFLQVQLAQDVGKQEATKAFQQIQKDYDTAGTLHGDDAAYLELRNSQFTATDAEDGVSLHRQMARNSALEGFLGKLDVQNNKYKAAENLEKLGRAFGNSINDMIYANPETSAADIWSNLVALDGLLAETSGLTNGQRKKIISERVMAIAIATDNDELLDPANTPDLFQDPATVNKFEDLKQTIAKKKKSDLAAEISLANAQRTQRNNQVIDDAIEGKLEKRAQEDGWGSLNPFEQEALINQRNKDTVSTKNSQAATTVTKELITKAFESEEAFLTDRLGTVINNPVTSKPVEMTIESLTSYLKATPDINPTDAKLLMKEIDGLSQQTGFNNNFKPVEQTIRKIVGEQLKTKTVYAEGGEEELIDLVEDFYREGYSAIINDTGKKPTPNALRSLALKAKLKARELIPTVLFDGTISATGSGENGGVSLDGTVNKPTNLTQESIANLSERDRAAYDAIMDMPEGADKTGYLKKFAEKHAEAGVTKSTEDGSGLKGSTVSSINEQLSEVTEELLEDYGEDDEPMGTFAKESFEEEKADLEAQVKRLEERLIKSQAMSEVEILTDRIRAVEAQTKPKGAMRLKMRNEKIAKLKQRLAEAEARESE